MKANAKTPNTRNPAFAYPNNIRLPKYRLHKRSGRGVIQFGPLWGKNPKYLAGLYNSPESLADYECHCRMVIDYKLKQMTARTEPPKKTKAEIRVAEFLERFRSWLTDHYYESDRREYNHYRRVMKMFRLRYGGRTVRSIGPLKLKRIRRGMIQSGWSRGHVNAQFNRLRSIFRWGVENELVKVKQLRALKAIRGLREGHTTAPERPEIAPAAWKVVERSLPFMADVLQAMVHVQHFTGMRSAELTQMTIERIEFRQDVWIYRPQRHKGKHLKKVKEIAIGPRSQSFLIPYMQVPSDQFLFSPRIARLEQFKARDAARKHPRYGKKKKLNPNVERLRPRYYSDSYWKAIGYAFDKLEKIENQKPQHDRKPFRWHPHQLRHARATVTQEDYGIEGSQSQLGNTIQATQIYAERNLKLAIKVALETG